jgi:DNA repair protein RadC
MTLPHPESDQFGTFVRGDAPGHAEQEATNGGAGGLSHGAECNAGSAGGHAGSGGFPTHDDTALLADLIGASPSRALRRLLLEAGGLAGLMQPATPAARCTGRPARVRRRVALAMEVVRRGMAQGLSGTRLLDSPDAVRDFLRLGIGLRPYEVFGVMFLDSQHRLLAFEEMFRGTVSQTSVYPREVVRRALEFNASAVVFAHNHPSGSVAPSVADRKLTSALRDALALVDVRTLDHLVVTRQRVFSFAEAGLV